MSEQPEALRLADELDGMTINEFYEALGDEAAAELRRLHEQNQRFYAQHASVVSDYEKAVVALKAQRDAIQQVVDEQAEDEGLWFRAETAAEAYLQQALRRLHAAVEGKARAAIKAVEETK